MHLENGLVVQAALGGATDGRDESMTGSCLCGAVEYEAAEVGPIVHCHCNTCRKAHAAAFASTARVNREHFRWVKGENKLSSFASSPGKVRQFCSVCGSHLVAKRAGQVHLILRVATLNDDPGARPSMHIWRSHDVQWLQDDGQIPSHAEWQPGR